MVLFADLVESPRSAAALGYHSLPKGASSSYKAQRPPQILIFACEEDLSHLKQINTAVFCASSDSEVEELSTVDTWSELGHRPLETFWKLGGKAERCE